MEKLHAIERELYGEIVQIKKERLVQVTCRTNLQKAAYFRRTKLSCGPFLPLEYIREDLGEYKQLSLAFAVV
jgi:hypothetical protein